MTVERRELSVRGTPIHLLTAGAGPPLLFLHGAGGAGRWLPFQERLATTFTVYAPSHPGHGGSPDAPWIEAYTDRKSTRLNSSHSQISYAVFCLKKKKKKDTI